MKLTVRLRERIPDCRPIGVNKQGLTIFRIKTAFHYYVNGVPHVVPAQFCFDGASIPWGLRNSFSPTDTRYLAAAAIHDLLYIARYYPQRLCDDIFLAAIEACGQTGKAKRTAMYWAVRLFGGPAYRQNTKAETMAARRLLGITEDRMPLFSVVRSV